MAVNLFIVAIAPVVIILVYVYIRDKYEREPFSLLLRALLAGTISVIPVVLVNTPLATLESNFSGFTAVGYRAFVVAATVEELFKFLAFLLVIWNHKAFNEKFDGIVYAVFVSLGFALIENIMYVNNYGISTGFMRAITAVPAHALFGIAMGYFLALAKFKKTNKTLNFIKALVYPILLHGIYDFILMSNHNVFLLMFLPFVFYLWWAGFKKMKVLSDNSRFRK